MTAEEIDALTGALRSAIEAAQPLPPKMLFTCAEAAEITGLPKSFFEDESAAGRIPSCKVGKYRRFSLAHLEEIVEATEVVPTSGPLAKARREKKRAVQAVAA